MWRSIWIFKINGNTGACNVNFDLYDGTICHNNFIINANQVLSLSSINTWDDGYPSGGNYWSDYNGTDFYSDLHQNKTGSDGIGDTAFVIDEYNQDRYPLMSPWGMVSGDINFDGIVDICDIIVAAMAFGATPEHPRWNPVVDINNDGTIDIYDLILIAKDFGKTA